MNPQFRIQGWALLLVAAGLFTISAFSYFETREFVRTARRTMGTVIKMEKRPESGDSGFVYRPVITFRDESGVTQEVESRVGTKPPAYQVGEQVIVSYPPGNPGAARFGRFFDLWSEARIAGIAGSVVLLLSARFLLIAPRMGQAEMEKASLP